MKVSSITLAGNAALSLFKFAAGIAGHSSAMISDAIHSASDVFSTLAVIFGYHLSSRDSDEEHPFGHERFECITALFLSFLLGFTGLSIGLQGIITIANGSYRTLQQPGTIAIIAAVLSIITKEAMFQYTKNAAHKIRSSALMADAWHHRSDALSSVGSLLGILGAKSGYPICDSLACIGICLLIVKAAVSIFYDAAQKLVDRSCDQNTTKKMQETICKIPGVLQIDSLHSRLFGAKIYVEVEISASPLLTLQESHAIAQNVHDTIEHSFPEVKHCMVHVNPYNPLSNPSAQTDPSTSYDSQKTAAATDHESHLPHTLE